jgi:rod shape-determining protein MreD
VSAASRAIPIDSVPRSVWAVPLLVAVAVLLEVAVTPFIGILDGVPDLLAPTVVAIGMLRGPLSGALSGMAGGLFIELTSPIGTLGVLALLYLCVGAFAGRYHGREESMGLVVPMVFSVAAAGAVELGYGVVQALLGNGLGPADLVGQVILPTMALTALLSPPMLLAARHLLVPREPKPEAGS